MLRQIQLTQDKVALVSGSDYDHLNQWKWLAKKDNKGKWYAARVENGKLIFMHRVIMGVKDLKIKVDHRDGNGLHNWRANLRACTNAENSKNRRRNRNNTSGYKGVTLDRGKYRARIRVNYKMVNIGQFETAIEAARAYDTAALVYHGDYARLNFPS